MAFSKTFSIFYKEKKWEINSSAFFRGVFSEPPAAKKNWEICCQNKYDVSSRVVDICASLTAGTETAVYYCYCVHPTSSLTASCTGVLQCPLQELNKTKERKKNTSARMEAKKQSSKDKSKKKKQ